MPRQFDLLIFDWDGTLMDSTAAIAGSICSACADMDLPVPTRKEASHIIGLGLTNALAALLPELPVDEYPRLIERYRYHFLRQDSMLTLFDGVADTIPRLHRAGYTVTVATGKNRAGLERALDSSRLRPYFHATRCADESLSKPDPAMIFELMEAFGVPAGRTLMIGDTSHDLLMAKNAGVASLGAGYGAHSKESLREFSPLFIADDFAGLSQWLNAHA
ncbi:MAG: HAD-IA family hydrolase [Burkholderiales bacterium]